MINRIGFFVTAVFFVSLLVFQSALADGNKILNPISVARTESNDGSPRVLNGGFSSSRCDRNILDLERDKPWMLPKLTATTADPPDTIRILAMRFDFQYEIPDDSNTTGRGQFDMRDTLAFFNEYGHMIDPSPHNRNYFEKHLEALNNYYFHVSDSNLILEWDVYPKDLNDVYHLPNRMAHYGTGQTSEEIITNLVDSFFIDCFQLVDSTEADLIFADYDAYILFHAGSDRQNDIGFPPTPSDLFTGYLRRGDDREPVFVDDGTFVVSDAIIMPEMASQDNRATALNAVMAHEFGHQLGLVDLYRTDNFFTQLGDFALMDNNGFGTGVDLGFEFVGRVFGTMPIYPMAWSRAYLGFIKPVVFRQGADISLVASEMIDDGIRIARIPINEYEYYLLENRQIDIDGRGDPALLADSATSVILGPVYYNPLDESKTFTNEYDFLLPGSGILIWHVDETVATMYGSGGFTRFEINQVQVDPEHRFIELIEADGLVNFGGNYYSGYGRHEDMYYAGNNSSFTPNTNPPSIGYGGANSHIRITGISASNTTMSLNLEFDLQSDGFPRRAGYPRFGFSPIAADIDGNGTDEIIAVSGRNLLVMNADGSGLFEASSPAPYYDTSFNSVGFTVDTVPLFARTSRTIKTGPVFGDFGIGTDTVIKFIAVGACDELRRLFYDSIYVYSLEDNDADGRGDLIFTPVALPGGEAVWLTFGNRLDVAVDYSDSIGLHSIDLNGTATPLFTIEEEVPYGFGRIDDAIVAIAGDSSNYVDLYLGTPDGQFSYDLDGFFNYGPIIVDLDRDGTSEAVVATIDGSIKTISIDPNSDTQPFVDETEFNLGDSITANPVAADLDADGYADLIFCGRNKIHALNRYFTALIDFPITVDRRFPELIVVSSPVVADIDNDGRQDIIAIGSNGNCYAFGPELLYGFPLPVGGIGAVSILLDGYDYGTDFKTLDINGYGSPLIYRKSNGGGLAFLAGDGWFYSWDTGYDEDLRQWSMYGGDPSGSFNFPTTSLIDPVVFSNRFPEEQFFCYPNPTHNGITTIRYFLGETANVTLSFYDMIGTLIAQKDLVGTGGVPNEFNWNGSGLASGIYRCILKADFGNDIQASFIDIAIVK